MEFWKGKKVFITGHTGFKGSWLSLWLQNAGALICGYSLVPPTNPSLFELARVSENMLSIHGDIRDREALANAVEKTGPDIVLHLAAQPLVRLSYKNPVGTFDTNVMGTVNILEAVRRVNSVKVLLCVTSDKCYQNREWVWGYREDEPMGGHDPYSSSKGCSELVVSAYRQSFFASNSATSIATARAGNVIGGGDWAQDRIVPDVMKAFMQSEPVIIRNPHAIRPWQHVLEPLNGYLKLVEQLWDHGSTFAEGWNFGPDDSDAKTVGWIVENLSRLWADGSGWINDTAGGHPHEATYLKLDCSKAKMLLKWSPALDLSSALEMTVEWYRAFNNKQDMREFTLNQIADYERVRGK
jgi:CDP-glucose 4,6-dehydratase